MTVEAPDEDNSFFTSSKMIDAVLACSAAKPLWTWTSEDTPGNRVVFRLVRKKLTSVKSDKLNMEIS